MVTPGLLPNGQQTTPYPPPEQELELQQEDEDPEIIEEEDDDDNDNDDDEDVEDEDEEEDLPQEQYREATTPNNKCPNSSSFNQGKSPSSVSSPSSRTPQFKKPSLSNIPFPLARVKRLLKSNGDTRMSSEAAYVIAKGVALFLDKLVELSFAYMIDDKRHSLTYMDLDGWKQGHGLCSKTPGVATNVRAAKRFHFLSDFVPEKVTAASALSELQKNEK